MKELQGFKSADSDKSVNAGHLFFITLLIILSGCSVGNKKNTDHTNIKKLPVKNFSIVYDKTIPTSLEASLGTMYMRKKGDYLIMYDAHVSDFKLVCMQYSTGKELWEVPFKVREFYFKDGNLVVQGHDHIEIFDIPTGKSLWKLPGSYIAFNYIEMEELGDVISIGQGEEKYLLDMKTKDLKKISYPILPATFFKMKEDGSIQKTCTDVKDVYNLGNEFILVDVVEKKDGKKQMYLWSLNEVSRKFTLKIYDDGLNPIKTHTWTIPENKYSEDFDRPFSGLPEPEKLSTSSYLINDQLIIFENYVNYRWSWGRGCNRITSINVNTHEINYQTWGQAPGDKEFYTFHFFNDIILASDGIMHFQDGDSKYKRFDMITGKMTDTLQKKFTLFKEYNPGIMLGFNYERKHIKDVEYTNKVSVIAWDYTINEYSKTFDFDFKELYPFDPFVFPDGTVIFQYYDDPTNTSKLYCCKVVIN